MLLPHAAAELGAGFEALEQEDLSPAAAPRIELGDFSAGNGFEFTAIFDVLPAIEPPSPDTLSITRCLVV